MKEVHEILVTVVSVGTRIRVCLSLVYFGNARNEKVIKSGLGVWAWKVDDRRK